MSERLTRWHTDDWPVAADWAPTVHRFMASPAGQALGEFVSMRIAGGATVYPPHPLRALQLTPLASVCAVIVGQDPYHGPGQAEGLAFSVPSGMRAPPSLRNIHKELARDLGRARSGNSLVSWAAQGVLLLNTCLTVEDGQPNSHAARGWEALGDSVLRAVASHAPCCVYLLWGAHAQKKADLIEREGMAAGQRQLMLHANHPSPLSALRPPMPFIGCGHFSAAARWLQAQGHPLDWLA